MDGNLAGECLADTFRPLLRKNEYYIAFNLFNIIGRNGVA